MRAARPELAAVVLAGGFGTRVRHLLPGLPKPMARVAGRPFLEHVVRYLGAGGVSRAIISTGYLAEVVESHFRADRVPGIAVTCVREASPRGTAGGFLQAVETAGVVPGAWLVLNGDSLVMADLPRFVGEFERSGLPAAILGLRLEEAARYGTLEVRSDGTLARFAEKRPGAGLINAGVYLFRPSLVAQFPASMPLSFETDVFPALIEEGFRILVHEVDAPFLDIGTPDSLARAEEFVRRHQPAPVPARR